MTPGAAVRSPRTTSTASSNLGTGRATSVHVYSPPLERMTFYRLVDGAMVAERTDERAESNWTP